MLKLKGQNDKESGTGAQTKHENHREKNAEKQIADQTHDSIKIKASPTSAVAKIDFVIPKGPFVGAKPEVSRLTAIPTVRARR